MIVWRARGVQKRAKSVQKPKGHPFLSGLTVRFSLRVRLRVLSAVQHVFEFGCGSLLHAFQDVAVGIGGESDRAMAQPFAHCLKVLVSD